eukprot:3451824-Prymnesium_polylepis.2
MAWLSGACQCIAWIGRSGQRVHAIIHSTDSQFSTASNPYCGTAARTTPAYPNPLPATCPRLPTAHAPRVQATSNLPANRAIANRTRTPRPTREQQGSLPTV